MRVSDVGYSAAAIMAQREAMMPGMTPDEMEQEAMGPYYGMTGLEQVEKEILSGGRTFITGVGLVGAAIQGVGAYLLLSNAPKWEGGWKTVGYAGGGLLALGAVGSVLWVIMGRSMIGFVERRVEEHKQQSPQMPSTLPMPSGPAWPDNIVREE